MSSLNPFKAIGKLFKKVGKVISKVWKAIKPIVKTVAIAAAIYFTAGTAAAYFAAPAAGLGAAASSTASSMYAGVASAWDSATSALGFGAPAATDAVVSTAVGPTIEAAEAAGPGASLLAGVEGGYAAPPLVAPAATGIKLGEIAKGIGTFVKDNGTVVSLLGSGLSNMAANSAARDVAEAELEYKRSLGLAGADQYGNSTFAPRTAEETKNLASDPSKFGIIAQNIGPLAAPATQQVQSQSAQFLTPQEQAILASVKSGKRA